MEGIDGAFRERVDVPVDPIGVVDHDVPFVAGKTLLEDEGLEDENASDSAARARARTRTRGVSN